jgi:flagellar assembly protein FliH
MTGARKFAFDTEFAPDGAILSQAPKRLGPEEVEAECAAAYERGKQDAVAQAERQTAAAAEALAKTAAMLLTRLDGESRAMREEAARVALAAARKIADAALEAFGEERAARAIEAVMDTLRHQPRLVVRLAPDMADKLAPLITELCDKHAYAGAVLVRPEPKLRAGDITIDWSDGVVSMSAEDTAQRINDLIESALAADASS